MKKLVCILMLACLSIGNTLASEKNWMMRFRGITVNPDESGTPTVVGGNATLSNNAVPEVDFSYLFNESFALELILASTSHEVGVAGITNNTSALDLGTVTLLPPTLSAQYHHQMTKWKPYIGVGLNFTHFYGVKPGALKTVNYDDSVGFAFQLGSDYEIASNTYLNFDIKKYSLSTDLTATTYTNTTVTAEVDINPWIVGLGVGYRF